jgi:hypothetical protein
MITADEFVGMTAITATVIWRLQGRSERGALLIIGGNYAAT